MKMIFCKATKNLEVSSRLAQQSCKLVRLFCLILWLCVPLANSAQNIHPRLILTKKTVQQMKVNMDHLPMLDRAIADIKKEVDADISQGISVPIPKDKAGGYTHNRHKKNFFILQKAGVLFQVLGNEKYAEHVKRVLLKYAEMYKGLPLHPYNKSYARGKIFWQCLNDANWLVYMSQAFDCIYDWLYVQDRQILERELFVPFADFLSKGNPQFFNRIHNHSTWGIASVGMIGLVMGNDDLVNRALYGFNSVDTRVDKKDNDGGSIYDKDRKKGFFANIDAAFSPDGYYTEGPYYQRYAMYPYLLFASALDNVKPQFKIFEHKNQVLIKSVYALLNLTKPNGDFFSFNDAQKGMSIYAPAMISAVDIAYYYGGKDPQLLGIAKQQARVVPDGTGLRVALDIGKNKAKVFERKSLDLTDGAKGKSGGVSILRMKDEQHNREVSTVVKYTQHGLSHGHFDKLSFSLYDDNIEVIQDYGMARFVNVEQKNGGRYLKENQTWAKQSIAHATVVVDKTSHFDGDIDKSSLHHGQKVFSDYANPNLKLVCVEERHAYPQTLMRRTVALLNDEDFGSPVMIDFFELYSQKDHIYDLSYPYIGQIISTNVRQDSNEKMNPFGDQFGYQHLYVEARSDIDKQTDFVFTWLNQNNFYSLVSSLDRGDQVFYNRIGANDSSFNLRREPLLVLRKSKQSSTFYLSAIETHGHYDAVNETAYDAHPAIKKIEVVKQTKAYAVIKIDKKSDALQDLFLFVSFSGKDNQLTFNGRDFQWTGHYLLTK